MLVELQRLSTVLGEAKVEAKISTLTDVPTAAAEAEVGKQARHPVLAVREFA
jgi:hypothetical protein